MFGFLKKKLKDAVSKFSKKAKEEAVEEEVKDEKIIKEAKKEEKELLKEEAEKKVEEIPLTDKEKEQQKKEKTPKKKKAEKPKSQPPKKPKKEEPTPKTPEPEKQKEAKKRPKKTQESKPKVENPEEEKERELLKKEVSKNHVAITYFAHGTTTDNEKDVASGHNDVALSALGKEQAKDLKNELTHYFDAIYTSDLQRAIDSARLCWGKKAEIEQDERLREADYGDFEQKSNKELDAYCEEHDLLKEGFPNGENLKEIEARLREFLNDLYDQYQGEHIAIVAHKFPQLALEVLLHGKTWEEAIKEDWRKKKAWQPGWSYTITEHLEEPEEETEKKTVEVQPEVPVKEEEKEEAIPEKKTYEEKEAKQPKKGFLKKLFSKKEEVKEATPEPVQEEEPEEEAITPEPIEKEAPEEEPLLEPEESIEEKPKEEAEEVPKPKKPKHGILSRLKETFTKKTLSEEKFEKLFWDLEVAMLENNVALEVIEKIKEDLKENLTTGKVSRLGIEDQILLSLKHSIEEILSVKGFDLIKRIKESRSRPFVIAFIGVNGSGKTTTLAKIANLFQEEGLSVVMAASDTFRAAAIDQLKEHATKLSIKLISQGYGADPAAVAYDAVEHAKAKTIDVVMIDTAGRLHSNTNLMAELEKVVRVAKPDMKIFIGESITGNDCVEQAKEFDKAVGIDAIILSKTDVDEKGGAAISVSYVTGKPILYLGVGQAYGDLKKFDKEEIIRNLGL